MLYGCSSGSCESEVTGKAKDAGYRSLNLDKPLADSLAKESYPDTDLFEGTSLTERRPVMWLIVT